MRLCTLFFAKETIVRKTGLELLEIGQAQSEDLRLAWTIYDTNATGGGTGNTGTFEAIRIIALRCYHLVARITVTIMALSGETDIAHSMEVGGSWSRGR